MKRNLYRVWLCVSTLAAPVGIWSACGEEIQPDAVPVRVLTYNIGNPDAEDEHYPLRLKYQSYEDYMAEQLQDMEPEIAVLQEVLPPTHCETFEETDPAFTCYDAASREPPIRRVLGPNYTIACDARRHVECVGVHVDFGTIDGLEPGGFQLNGAETPPLPMATCDWAAGTCSDEFCDAEATVSAVSVQTDFGPMRVVHVHPNAAGEGQAGIYTGAPCRALQLEQVFRGISGYGDAPLISDDLTIVAGDFNMDPVRLISDAEQVIWDEWVGESNRFADLAPLDENGVQHATRRQALGLAIDHVLAERYTGDCTVHGDDYIGTDPGTLPLDEDFDWTQVPDGEFYAGRIDHFALSCDLVLDFTE